MLSLCPTQMRKVAVSRELPWVGSFAPGLAPCGSWAPGDAAPGRARQPGLGISGLLSVLVKSLSF